MIFLIITFGRSKPNPMKTFYQFRILTLTAFVVCVLSTMVYAQTSRASFEVAGGPGFSFLRGGMSVSSIHDGTGFQVGLFTDIRINQIFSVHTGLSFDRKNSKYPAEWFGQSNFVGEHFNLNYDYFSLPLVIRASFFKPVKFYINTGIFVARIHSMMQIAKGNFWGPICYDYTSFVPDYEFGLVNGIGVKVPLHKQLELTAEIRNNRGLSDVKLTKEYLFGGDPNVRTNLTTLMVGISMRLGK
jgi:hypothetical protein